MKTVQNKSYDESHMSIHLQGIGRHQAMYGRDIVEGTILVWNFGSASVVKSIEWSKSGKTAQVITEVDNKTYTRRLSANTLYAYKTPQPAPQDNPVDTQSKIFDTPFEVEFVTLEDGSQLAEVGNFTQGIVVYLIKPDKNGIHHVLNHQGVEVCKSESIVLIRKFLTQYHTHGVQPMLIFQKPAFVAMESMGVNKWWLEIGNHKEGYVMYSVTADDKGMFHLLDGDRVELMTADDSDDIRAFVQRLHSPAPTYDGLNDFFTALAEIASVMDTNIYFSVCLELDMNSIHGLWRNLHIDSYKIAKRVIDKFMKRGIDASPTKIQSGMYILASSTYFGTIIYRDDSIPAGYFGAWLTMGKGIRGESLKDATRQLRNKAKS